MVRVTALLVFFLFVWAPALAQNAPDAAKLAPVYRQQRDVANEQIAILAAQLQEALERLKTAEAERDALKAAKQ